VVHPKLPRRLAAGLALLTAASVLTALSDTAGAAAATSSCRPWTTTTLLSGQGGLENSLTMPDGTLLVTDNLGGRLLRVTPAGQVTVLATDLPAAGGLARSAGSVYVTTGDGPIAALLGLKNGTIQKVDPTTGQHQVWATDLIMPNGLAFLPGGSALVTRGLNGVGTDSYVTRMPVGHRTQPQYAWSDLVSTNGIAVDPTGKWVYVDQFIGGGRARVWRLQATNPTHRTLVADLGPSVLVGLDDLAVAPDGNVFVAADFSAGVYRINPSTGASCLIAKGMPLASSVEIIPDRHGHPAKIYVTSILGKLYVLTPPAS
jgi:sugar lactone lactonase YvrE